MTDDPIADYHRYQTRLDLFDDEEELAGGCLCVYDLGRWDEIQKDYEEEQEPCF